MNAVSDQYTQLLLWPPSGQVSAPLDTAFIPDVGPSFFIPKKQCGIYGIRNKTNGKWYIGQSIHLRGRINCHFAYLRSGKHRNEHLQQSFIKYGRESFEFYVLEETTEDMMDVKERAWIIRCKSMDNRFGYNIEHGGNLQKHLPPSTLQKMSAAMKGNKFSVGRKHSDAIRLKISMAVKGTYVKTPARMAHTLSLNRIKAEKLRRERR
jgi:group I intron endonuclease